MGAARRKVHRFSYQLGAAPADESTQVPAVLNAEVAVGDATATSA